MFENLIQKDAEQAVKNQKDSFAHQLQNTINQHYPIEIYPSLNNKLQQLTGKFGEALEEATPALVEQTKQGLEKEFYEKVKSLGYFRSVHNADEDEAEDEDGRKRKKPYGK